MNRVIVDKNGHGNYLTVTEALANIADNTEIFINPGIYKEKIIIDKPNISLKGRSADEVTLTYDDGAFMMGDDGEPIGTFKTASVHVLRSAEGFSAENITFQNTAGRGETAGQAVALYLDCDKAVIKNCRLKARQDTLLTAPMHLDIAENPEILNRQYFENCYIEGDVDFIFGAAVAVFKDCTIFSLNRDKEINGYVTAACTSKVMKFGYVFIDCDFKSDAADGTVYLGRPWREYAKTVLINCHLDAHIHKNGFSKWNDTDRHKTCYYAQYKSYGDGYSEDTLAEWTNVLSDSEKEAYTIDNIFQGWNPTEN